MTELEYLKKYLPNDKLEEGIRKYNLGIPVQYIVGNVDFYGNIIEVNKNVLIPRFETEELVDRTIKRLKNKTNLDIVDLGTGSGCIAIALAKNLDCHIDAVDISKEALEVAKKNAINNQVSINFYLGDMLTPLNKKYDLIISNPPYIAHDEEIMSIVKNNEPHIALYADNNGLYYYEKILSNCNKYLNKNGLIAFEIGHNQAEIIKKIAYQYLDCEVVVEKDLQKKDRFIFISLKNWVVLGGKNEENFYY